MNITKLSGSIFMVFVLISAPFFAIQTKQDGINRVLADDYKISSDTLQILETIEQYDPEFINGGFRAFRDGILQSLTDYATTELIEIINNSIIIDDINKINAIYFWDENINYIGQFNSGDATLSTRLGLWPNIFVPQNAKYFSLLASNNNDPAPIISFSTFISVVLEYSFISIIGTPQQNYYDIFENARLANYSDVDGFTNIFYQIPRMANSIANTYNRFIGFTDNLNPFRVRDESTGEFRDQTPSEVMDSWPARIISWFRRFTD